MKLVIFEGLDNIGKSTVIKAYASRLRDGGVDENRIKTIHFDHPSGSTASEQIMNIDKYNIDMCTAIVKLAYSNDYDYCLLDRSWYSEYVYGSIYRSRDSHEVLQKILKVEYEAISRIGVNNVSFILLTCDNPDFVIKHEDGCSLSNYGDTDSIRTRILMEMRLFNEVFDESFVPLSGKGKILMNVGDNYNDIDVTMAKVMRIASHKNEI